MPTLGLLGAIDTVLFVAVLALLGGLLLSGKRWLLPLVALALALVPLNRATGMLALSESKGLSEQGMLFSRWNSFSRVTVVQPEDPDRQLIFIDSDAATVIYRDGERRLERTPSSGTASRVSRTTWGAATRCSSSDPAAGWTSSSRGSTVPGT